MKHRNYTYALFLIFVSVLCFGYRSDAHAAKAKTTVAFTSVKLPQQKIIKKKLRVPGFRFYKAFGNADTTPWDVTSNGSDIHRTAANLKDRYLPVFANIFSGHGLFCGLQAVLIQQQSVARHSFVSVIYKLIFPKHWFW